MGDHRADIKLEMTIHGKTYKHSMWINYWDDGDGCDYRVRDWFAECWADAKSRYNEQVAKDYQEQHAKEIEAAEREQLKKLREKYGDGRG